MSVLARRSMLSAVLASLAWAAGLGGGGRCLADPVLFDPDGAAAGNSPVVIGGLDWSVGNAVAIGGNQAVANFLAGSGPTTFEVRYQAVLAGYIDTNGTTIAPSGINQPGGFEITVVAKFFEQVVSVSTAGSIATASFAAAADQTGGFFEIWYDAAPNASNLAGTGFQDGLRILSGAVASASGNFTVTSTNGSVLLDQFGPDNYNGQQTVPGIGASQVRFNVDQGSVDPNFFLSPILSVAFNTTNKLAFQETNPSALFFGYAPSIGSINGALPIPPGGRDIIFQADGNNSFAVPEPSSLALAGLGLVGMLASRRLRRRRRERP